MRQWGGADDEGDGLLGGLTIGRRREAIRLTPA
jgi:hypothetical protein